LILISSLLSARPCSLLVFNLLLSGIVNYRDQIHERFFQRLNRRNIVQFTIAAFVLPVAFWGAAKYSWSAEKERKAQFLNQYKMPQSLKENNGIKD
jgi:hypothetical protein